jgi:hypothetical protein
MAKTTINGEFQVTSTATFAGHVDIEDIAIGGGQSITKFLGATVTHDASSISAHDEETFTATVTGVLVAGANIVVVSTPTNYQAELITTANVTANDVVTVRIHNTDNGGSIDPPTATFNIGVIQFSI